MGYCNRYNGYIIECAPDEDGYKWTWHTISKPAEDDDTTPPEPYECWKSANCFSCPDYD